MNEQLNTNNENNAKTTEVSSKALPNKAFDMEYSTQTKREMLFLKEKGIEPCYRKRTADYHIPTYKYKKTSELFLAVAEYYKQIENEKAFAALKKAYDNGVTIATGTLEAGTTINTNTVIDAINKASGDK